MVTEPPGTRNFADGTTNTLLAAALAAMGVQFAEKPNSIVTGDGIAGSHRISWYFAETSECGKYNTKALIAAWEDKAWHEKNPDHPWAYIKCAFENHTRLVDKLKQGSPLGMVRRRGKIALVSLNATKATQDIIFRRL